MATAATRAKDSDRNDTCQILDSALADGQLSAEEHRQRVAAATTAVTLGDLRALVTDLQTADAPVQLPTLKTGAGRPVRTTGWGVLVAGAAVLLVVGIATGWGLYAAPGQSPMSAAQDPGAKPDGVAPLVLTPPRQLQSLGGLTGLLAQMKQKFGDTTGYELNIYSDFAILERPDPAEPRRVLRYDYRGGWDDPDTTTVSSDERVVDLGKFNVEKITAILHGAPETLGIKRDEIKTVYVDIKAGKDITAPPDALAISIYVSGKFNDSGYIELDGDGNQKRINYPG
ncbi:DUF1707 domain-containing protein [Mycobacterium sp. CBMA293]|uniref:DUF1707 SHOCT-like domain-containing protein n=1 Tax=unclassified Mycolicibacterium TaxID=2636767 RepID=UPI0012DD1245|nr:MULTISPECIES: DUF1707 domain-containing protein [unclassified Mycolicibacterium]MUL49836.1 DUF1707 domain-containing protein [Mycolicibacterium sp. CBMA 360]MUL59623.1 DUF1707 domain-containing protein [Mycolicibacterium sp. CBMA 335]MUL71348.1 DUF1707 domain-containing protein [Mycolicibacterium sp. CBMA 311]MUL94991.1 DUF1707 domain-containing protein [Mycolicibacterium sp. CBMA 230]MUM03828.1 hypothetical protein [Mycolicibacterium sp. CBMA 213]